MSDTGDQSTSSKPSRTSFLAHIISDIFSPLLMPTYGMAIALWLTMLRFIPFSVKLWAIGGVFIITSLIPWLIIIALIRIGKVSDMAISKRSERFIPFIVAIVCYLGAAVFVHSIQAPTWLTAFYVAAAVVIFLTSIITLRWKISAHAGGVAGLAAAIYWLAAHGLIFAAPLTCFSIAVAIVGAVAWARLYLNHHTPLQVLAGVVISSLVIYATLSLSIYRIAF